ncbi:MAG TPA: response regulator [Geobacteraceae bacterium]|nr:response regulator [Geobacteraceae bacterium]
MRILLVDDNAAGRMLLRQVLENHGCEVMEAANGDEGLQMARNIGPALIISDVFMPKMDGFQFLHEVKTDPVLQRVPFVFYSSVFADRNDEELAMSLGAAAFIVKPKDSDEFWTGICSAMERGESVNEAKRDTSITTEENRLNINQTIIGRMEEKFAEMKKARSDLERSDERYRCLLESVTDYIYTVQVEDGRALATSHGPGSVAVTGYTPEEYEADPDLWFRIIHEEDRGTVRELTSHYLLENGAILPFQHRIIHKNGSVRWIRNTTVPHYDQEGRVVAYDGLISDITEFKKLEDQFRHAQKMEAVGVLAGGIAHDFNNILTAIIGYGTLLQMQLKNDHSARHNVEQILAAGEKAANLVHGLLAFSRKQIINPKPAGLNNIIRIVEKLLSRLLTEDIELKVNLTDSETTIMADPGQIDQILMNLATNARDAMPKGGVLTIETSIMSMDREYLLMHGYGIQGHYVWLSVSDNGMGIDEQTRQKIFEPFFTTKPMGKGTGLGLSIVYGIVKQHNGFIDVQSTPGMGTTFNIFFPLVKAKPQGTATISSLPALGENQTILIADDDMQVRDIIRITLENSGYKVIEAEDGEMAVQQFAKYRDEINLLILDIVMPKKNGKDAYDEIRKIRQEIKVLFISGYTSDVIDLKVGMGEELNIVSKPVSPRELLLKIKGTLDNPGKNHLNAG